MAAPKRKNTQIARDRREIANLYLKGWLQSRIVDHINKDESRGYTLTQQMISYDLCRLQAQWRESALIDIDEAKAKELAKIDRLEREYWDAWERSKENAETSVSESVNDGRGGHTKAQLRAVGQVGDPRFLKGVEWCIERRCKVLGVDAPEKTDQSGDITIKVMYENANGQVKDASPETA